MLKRFSLRKIIIATLLFFVAIILYSFPEELKKDYDFSKNNDIHRIFLIDSNNFVGMTNIKWDYNKDIVEETIKCLTENSECSDNIPSFFNSSIPSGTKLLSYELKDGLLKLNFNENFLSIKKDMEEKMISSLVYSLIDDININKIMIFVNDKQIQVMPSGLRIGLYLDKSFGVNKVYDLDRLEDTSLITIYYLGKDNDDYYYIPVSYITNDEDDSVNIIIRNLKTVSLTNSNLRNTLNYDVQLINYEINDDVMNLNFNEGLLSFMIDGKLKEEVKYTLSYTIKDNFGINSVVFLVNNEQIDEFKLEN